jgi:hypothetical protein
MSISWRRFRTRTPLRGLAIAPEPTEICWEGRQAMWRRVAAERAEYTDAHRRRKDQLGGTSIAIASTGVERGSVVFFADASRRNRAWPHGGDRRFHLDRPGAEPGIRAAQLHDQRPHVGADRRGRAGRRSGLRPMELATELSRIPISRRRSDHVRPDRRHLRECTLSVAGLQVDRRDRIGKQYRFEAEAARVED